MIWTSENLLCMYATNQTQSKNPAALTLAHAEDADE